MRFVYVPGVKCPHPNQSAHTSELHALLLLRKLSLQTRHIIPNLEEQVDTFEVWQNWKGLAK